MARNTSSPNTLHQRMRRKLYLLTLIILIPFFPLQMLFMYSNTMNSIGRMQAYNFDKIHNSGIFTRITFSVYDQASFSDMNLNYISVITVIPIVWFFGATKEAMNTYRTYFLALGLGKWFPKLHDEYDPDRTRTGAPRSWGAQFGSLLKSNKSASE
jgi:pheromone a factor receptor